MMKIKDLLSILFWGLSINHGYSQDISSDTIYLYKSGSAHLYAKAVLQKKIPVTVMIESGMPIVLLDSAFAFRHKEELNLKIERVDKKMNLGGDTLLCHYQSTLPITINNLIYKGEILITDLSRRKIDLMYPLHQSLSKKGDKSIFEINLKEGYILPLSPQEMHKKRVFYRSYKIRDNEYRGMYTVRTLLETQNEEGLSSQLEGDFLIDFGNAMYLFLFFHNAFVKEFVANSGIQARQGYNGQGKPVPVKLMIPGKMRFADTTLAKPYPIGLTSAFRKFKSYGSLGIKFFEETPCILDFKRNRFYIKN